MNVIHKTALLVFLATALAYVPSTFCRFIAYDDNQYIYRNPMMERGLTPSTIKWSFNVGYAENWHPLTWISLAADVSLMRGLGWKNADFSPEGAKRLHQDGIPDFWTTASGPLPAMMHAHNVLLHAANATLLFLLLLILLSQAINAPDPNAHPPLVNTQYPVLSLALLVLLWSIHPLRCEVVCWVSERKELLSVFFMLLSLLYYIHPTPFKTLQSSQIPQTSHSLVRSLIFFVLALLAKPVAVSLPAVFFAYDFVLRRRSFRDAVVRVLPFAVASLASCVLTLQAQQRAMSGDVTPLLARLTQPLAAPFVYLRETVCPYGLCVFNGLDLKGSVPMIAAGLLLLAGLAYFVIRWFLHRNRPAAWESIVVFGISWAYVGLVPMLGFVRVGLQDHADRYTYWPGCGLLAAAVLLLARRPAWFAAPALRKTTAVLVAFLALAVFSRTRVWYDTIPFFADAARGGDPIRVFDYADVLEEFGHEEKAGEVVRGYVSDHLDDPVLLARYAEWCARKGAGLADAAHYARRALELDHECWRAFRVLASIAEKENRLDDARALRERALLCPKRDLFERAYPTEEPPCTKAGK